MSEIKIKYNEVRSTVSKITGHLASEADEMESSYKQVISGLAGVDGAANAAFILAVKQNSDKGIIVKSTFQKLLYFVSNSATQIESEEKKIANNFTTTVSRVGR